MNPTSPNRFDQQYSLDGRDYLEHLDFYTWTRHFHVFKDVATLVTGDLLEVGTGDGVVRRCSEPFLRSTVVMDINPRLKPDVVGNLLDSQPALEGRFDAVVCTEVLEHIPFNLLPRCLAHLHSFLRPGGMLFLTLPHRKGHMLVVTPRQRLVKWRFPVGLTSLGEAYNRFVRRRIWIDPHHCWEIGDGHVRRSQIDAALLAAGLHTRKFTELPYCDYWVLQRPAMDPA
ncbi:MAG: class I SAM-dependent methyltransferase [Burkholderiaceae bacterium]|nr:class I SAM-dependent methyltransferase [Burkholderiaceae bacterium]